MAKITPLGNAIVDSWSTHNCWFWYLNLMCLCLIANYQRILNH